jgi:hypothetical protein
MTPCSLEDVDIPIFSVEDVVKNINLQKAGQIIVSLTPLS